jgi:CRISPR/Cas system-associated endonuclease Cas1
MKKRTLFIRDPDVKVFYRESHIEVVGALESQYIGFEQILAIHLYYSIELKIKDMVLMAKRAPVYFVDEKGKLMAGVSFQI